MLSSYSQASNSYDIYLKIFYISNTLCVLVVWSYLTVLFSQPGEIPESLLIKIEEKSKWKLNEILKPLYYDYS